VREQWCRTAAASLNLLYQTGTAFESRKLGAANRHPSTIQGVFIRVECETGMEGSDETDLGK
jgi:hypothetical protein